MVCPDAIKRKEEKNIFEIFKRDEILELVRLKKENPEKYKEILKDIAEVLRDVAETVDEVNKK